MTRRDLALAIVFGIWLTAPWPWSWTAARPSAQAVATPSREPVRLVAADGTAINGWFVKAGDGRRGAALFSMCSRGAIEGWAPLAAQLAAQGISSLVVTSPTPRPVPVAAGGPARNTRDTDADAVVAALSERLSPGASLAVGGGSCGVHLALLAATRHADRVRAAVLLSGPYADDLPARVARQTTLAVFSGASRSEGPAIGWAEALRAASTHPASRVLIRDGTAHGTEMFDGDDLLVADVASWLSAQLSTTRR